MCIKIVESYLGQFDFYLCDSNHFGDTTSCWLRIVQFESVILFLFSSNILVNLRWSASVTWMDSILFMKYLTLISSLCIRSLTSNHEFHWLGWWGDFSLRLCNIIWYCLSFLLGGLPSPLQWFYSVNYICYLCNFPLLSFPVIQRLVGRLKAGQCLIFSFPLLSFIVIQWLVGRLTV